MKRLNYLVGLSILTALIVALVASIPASAYQPDHSLSRWDLDLDYPNCGVTIPSHLDAKQVDNVFFDQNGDVRLKTIHYGGTTWTMTYNGHTLVWRDVENAFTVQISPTETLGVTKGLNFAVNVPGHGIVYGTMGKVVWTNTCAEDGSGCTLNVVDFSGFFAADQDAVCNYMLFGE